MSLNDLRRGEWAKVLQIPDDSSRVQLLRFGITPGVRVCCHARVPFGPVVLKYGGQEIAVGRAVAGAIAVESEAGAVAPRARA
ncbi:MAG: FeoA family protein [Deferrisomatales bacterium]